MRGAGISSSITLPLISLFDVPPDYQVKEVKGDVMFMKDVKK